MKLIKLFLIGLLWCAIALAMPGCRTQQKFNKIADKHPLWLAEKCTEKFPVQETTIEGKRDTITITETRTDTVTATIINTVTGKPVTVKIPCPACKSITNTIYKTDTIIRKDTAKEFVLTNSLNEAKGEIKDLEKGNKNKNTAIWILSGICLVLGGLGAVRMFLR